MARERPGFNHKGVLALGIIQLICGVTSIILGGVQIALGTRDAYIGYSIWNGVFFVVPGILGITSWKYKNAGNIIALMVTCIIASFCSFLLLIFASVSLTADVVQRCWGQCWFTSAVPLESVLVFIAVLEFIVSITCSAFCCASVCCGARPTQGHVIRQGPQPVFVANSPGYCAQVRQYVCVQTPVHHQYQPQPIVYPGYVTAQPQQVVVLPPYSGQMMVPPTGSVQQPGAQAQGNATQGEVEAPPAYAAVDHTY